MGMYAYGLAQVSHHARIMAGLFPPRNLDAWLPMAARAIGIRLPRLVPRRLAPRNTAPCCRRLSRKRRKQKKSADEAAGLREARAYAN